jgi:hypothetical protein
MCPNFGLSGPADFCSDFARPRRAVLAGLVAFKDRREDFAARLLAAAAVARAHAQLLAETSFCIQQILTVTERPRVSSF